MPKGCASSRGAVAVHRESVLHLDCASTNDGVPASALTTTIRNPIEDCWSVVNPALADSRRIRSPTDIIRLATALEMLPFT